MNNWPKYWFIRLIGRGILILIDWKTNAFYYEIKQTNTMNSWYVKVYDHVMIFFLKRRSNNEIQNNFLNKLRHYMWLRA